MSNGPDNSITEEYQTIAELLTEQGYKNSGIVAHTRILPEEGFGRGFHRYALQNMTSWLKRNQDASTVVDTLLQWLDADVKTGSDNLFYFAHVFDPHYPYIPPLSRTPGDIDLSAVEAFREAPQLYEYEESLSQEIPLDPEVIETIKSYYAESLEYTASQLVRFINELKRKEMFEDAFIIIAGDHGEEFYERGLSAHGSLHDANIRSGLIVKPPADSSITVPEDPDLIDIFPTIAEFVDADIPAYCSGRSWCDGDEWIRDPRITELIRPEKYNLAVEEDGQKAIYTYDSNFPYRPDEAAVDAGPTKAKYYTVSAAREYSTRDLGEVSEDKRRQLLEIAERFLNRSTVHQQTDADRSYQPTAETNEQLKKLGYK
jgi:arylsulfatase A-like enzyme